MEDYLSFQANKSQFECELNLSLPSIYENLNLCVRHILLLCSNKIYLVLFFPFESWLVSLLSPVKRVLHKEAASLCRKLFLTFWVFRWPIDDSLEMGIHVLMSFKVDLGFEGAIALFREWTLLLVLYLTKMGARTTGIVKHSLTVPTFWQIMKKPYVVWYLIWWCLKSCFSMHFKTTTAFLGPTNAKCQRLEYDEGSDIQNCSRRLWMHGTKLWPSG